jgi:hypothetical protein
LISVFLFGPLSKLSLGGGDHPVRDSPMSPRRLFKSLKGPATPMHILDGT